MSTLEEISVQHVIANYIHVSATILLLYDSLITLPREVRQVWSRGPSWFAVLYLTNRYCAILHRVMTTLQHLHGQTAAVSIHICQLTFHVQELTFVHYRGIFVAIHIAAETLDVFTWLAIAAFSALRMYALTGKRWWSFVFLMLLASALPVIDVYASLPFTPNLRSPFVACDLSTPLTLSAYRIYRLHYHAEAINSPSLIRTIVRDGSLYFLVLFLLNLFDIISLQIAVNGALADFVTVMSVILVARFLLDLREFDAQTTAATSAAVSSVAFASRPVVEDEESSPSTRI
ncbi:hypothetical protein C8Q74DRAFT_1372393 [Fomes fomentarius]|nr:hypothetical protein C8Q74DRAFT_1372393 [Fomes fomentarius]